MLEMGLTSFFGDVGEGLTGTPGCLGSSPLSLWTRPGRDNGNLGGLPASHGNAGGTQKMRLVFKHSNHPKV